MNAAVNKSGFSETTVWSGQSGGCGNPDDSPKLSHLLSANGQLQAALLPDQWRCVQQDQRNEFIVCDRTGSRNTRAQDKVLVRLVNAGSRMHVPSIVGSQTVRPR